MSPIPDRPDPDQVRGGQGAQVQAQVQAQAKGDAPIPRPRIASSATAPAVISRAAEPLAAISARQTCPAHQRTRSDRVVDHPRDDPSAAPALPATRPPPANHLDRKRRGTSSIFSSCRNGKCVAGIRSRHRRVISTDIHLRGGADLSSSASRIAIAAESSYKVWYDPSLQYDEHDEQHDHARRQRAPAPAPRSGSRRRRGSSGSSKLPSSDVDSGWTPIRSSRSTGSRFEEGSGFRVDALDEQGANGCSSLTERSAACRRIPSRRCYRRWPFSDALLPRLARPRKSATANIGSCSPPAGPRRIAARRTKRCYDTYTATLNTYAAIYNGVMHGDWFEARAAATRPRSMRRCSETPSRRASSKT